MNEIDDNFPDCWPRAGDRLFAQDTRGYDTQIAESFDERIYRMKVAFKEAADLLVEQALRRNSDDRNLVWPIVFCYRQYIELALKYVIAKHGQQAEPPIEPLWKTHRLGTLWKYCKQLMGETLIDSTTDEIPEVLMVEALINEFDEADAGSFNFRYPTDTEGWMVELPFSSIDLFNLRRVMEGIYGFLDANESVLGMHFDGEP